MRYPEAFERAVITARQHLPIQAKVAAEPRRLAIVLFGARYSVHNANAWAQPESVGVLPWFEPPGEIVAYVETDGTVTHASKES